MDFGSDCLTCAVANHRMGIFTIDTKYVISKLGKTKIFAIDVKPHLFFGNQQTTKVFKF